MATSTARVASSSTTDGTTFTGGAFTPAQDDLLVVHVVATGTVASAPTLASTGGTNGITFSRHATTAQGSSLHTGYLFLADQLVGASPTSMTCLFTCSQDAASGFLMTVVSWSGMTKLGTQAVLQTQVINNGAGATTPVMTFAQATQAANPVVSFYGHVSSNVVTAPTGWQATVAPTNISTPTYGHGYSRRDSGHSSATVTWGSTATAHLAISYELDASSSAVEGPIRYRLQNREAIMRAARW